MRLKIGQLEDSIIDQVHSFREPPSGLYIYTNYCSTTSPMNMDGHEMKRSLPEDNISDFLFYTTSDGDIRIEVVLKDESVWLTQQLMADLFQTTVPNISMHIQNIYKDEELTPESTVKKFLTVRSEGQR
jgi:hypothetical protein